MFDASLVETTEYLLPASAPRIVICGDKATGYAPRVRGTIIDDGREIEVALAWYYRDDYETKAEAMECARNLLRVAKHYRQASI